MGIEVLRVKEVSKYYKNSMILDNISFSIKQGEIFGLIGENGAGKTTLMRIIAGCTDVSSGKIFIMGKDGGNSLQQMRKFMGAIIEHPACYGDMTASENLKLIGLAKGIQNKKNISELLEIVGLQDFSKKRVNKFSLGMKQRLGIAIALIGSPKFLILDEPINGLDPNGIVDIRNTIQRLNREKGITFLISSHVLTELHQIASTYGILHQGKLVAEHTSKELENQFMKQIIIKYEGSSKKIIESLKKYNVDNIIQKNNLIVFNDTGMIPKLFLKDLINKDINILEYHADTESLEDYFIRLTKKIKNS